LHKSNKIKGLDINNRHEYNRKISSEEKMELFAILNFTSIPSDKNLENAKLGILRA